MNLEWLQAVKLEILSSDMRTSSSKASHRFHFAVSHLAMPGPPAACAGFRTRRPRNTSILGSRSVESSTPPMSSGTQSSFERLGLIAKSPGYPIAPMSLPIQFPTVAIPRRRFPFWLAGVSFWLLSLASSHLQAIERLDFNYDIQPLLSDRCFTCHGPDEKQRKGKLRLDTKEGALSKNTDGKFIIKPGDPDASEFIRRIETTDPDDVMPPAEVHLDLNRTEKDLLRRWIKEGAEFRGHWAFNPVRQLAPPTTQDARWPKTEIDQFVLARLEREGLKPSPEATRERLLRRVTFDLTGLPPTLPDIDVFLNDASSNAYEKAVDRLLASTTFGERQAVEWLDLARYADTHGYQADRYRSMWPWRDWVIRSFNENLPYDKFITWQIAGDLIDKPTKQSRLATAFNRLHMQNEEGGIVEEEFRVAYIVDRVNTFCTAFLAMTSECSRCHDHKYDPMSQRDFYQLYSFFQNIDESGQSVYFGEVMPVPTLLLSTEEQDARLETLQNRIQAKQRQAPGLRNSAQSSFEVWLKQRPTTPEVPGLTAAYSFDELKENKFTNSIDASKPANAVESPKSVPGHSGQGVLLSGENGINFPGVGAFTRSDPFSLGLWVNTATHAPRLVVLHKSRAWMDAGSRGYELILENGRPTVGLIHMWPGNAIKVRSREPLSTNSWAHVTVTYDGSSRAAGVALYVNGAPVAVDVVRDGLWKDFTYGGGEPDVSIGFRMRDNGFKEGRVDELRLYNRALTPLEAAHIAGRDDLSKALSTELTALGPTQRQGLLDYYIGTAYPPAKHFNDELSQLRREQNQLVNSIQDIMVMQEMPQPKKAYVLRRGAYDAATDEVHAGTPGFLPALAHKPESGQSGSPHTPNRLDLAQWLLSPQNPLFARVTVNRAWQMFFGRGLVESTDNFGVQGALPSHPELIDWMARDFQSHWDWKRLMKQIAMSATYRQGSRGTPELVSRDPSNKLLARGPSRRLTAEMLRDQSLAASGILVRKIGGPSVKPYQPEGLWEMAMGGNRWQNGNGDDLHRRSLYTFWKRTVPHPAMMVFDAADRSNCSVKRQSTSTPLQSLALLNDPQHVEAARFIAQRMIQEGGSSVENRLTHGFRLVTSRKPTSRELTILNQTYREQRELFQGDAQAAARLLIIGEAANDPTVDPIDLAATTIVGTALLNHDEAIMRR